MSILVCFIWESPHPGLQAETGRRSEKRSKTQCIRGLCFCLVSITDVLVALSLPNSFLIPSWKLSFKATEKVTLYYGGIKGSLSLEPRGVFIDISVCYLLRGIDSRRDGTSRSETNASSLESTKRRRARATKHTTRRQRICGENVTQWHIKR